jgi:hypothetical protein
VNRNVFRFLLKAGDFGWNEVSEAFNRERSLGVNAFFDVGTELVHGPLSKRQNGGVLAAEK